MLINLCSSSLTFNIHWVCMLSHFSRVWVLATPKTVACQAPLSMGFSRQEHWSGLLLYPLDDCIYQMWVYTEDLTHSPADGRLIVSTFFWCCLVNVFLWGRSSGVELLGHGVYTCSALVDSTRRHSKAAEPGSIPAQSVWDSSSLPLCQHLVFSASVGMQGCVVALLKLSTWTPPCMCVGHSDILLWWRLVHVFCRDFKE